MRVYMFIPDVNLIYDQNWCSHGPVYSRPSKCALFKYDFKNWWIIIKIHGKVYKLLIW